MLGGVVRWTFALFVLFQVVGLIPLVACGLQIIDDLHGDLSNSSNPVQFLGTWDSSQFAGCPFCYGHQLDYSQVVQGSWHYNGDVRNLMNLSFVGTSITVYYILPQFGVPISTSFILDGTPQHDAFIHNPTNDSKNPFIYNATAFHADGLENLQHHLLVSINDGSAILFDYATYDHVDSEDDTTAPPPSASGSSSEPSPTSAMSSAPGTPTADNVSTTSHVVASIDTSTPSPSSTSTSSAANTFTASPSAGILSTALPESSTSSSASSASSGQSLASLSGSAAPASSSSGGTIAVSASSATVAASPLSSSRMSQIGIIVGAASGGCVVIVIALLSFCIWSRRRRRAGHDKLRKTDALGFLNKNDSALTSNDDILGSFEANDTARDQMNPKQMAAERRTFFARSRDTHVHTASSAGSDLPLVGTPINVLQAETDRIRAQYAAGPPPTYVSEHGLDRTSTEIV